MPQPKPAASGTYRGLDLPVDFRGELRFAFCDERADHLPCDGCELPLGSTRCSAHYSFPSPKRNADAD